MLVDQVLQGLEYITILYILQIYISLWYYTIFKVNITYVMIVELVFESSNL